LYGLGSENENLPGFVVLRPTPNIVVGPALWSNSFLPSEYQATGVITSDMSVDKLVANVRNSVLAPTQQRRQIDLIQKLNHLHAAKREHDTALEGQIKAMETAYRMQSAASDAFDISREPAKMRELYGDTPFGRSCLLARRLAESGVRYISVYYTSSNNQPWDTHSDHYKRHPELCADSDRASAALISDLKQRGLLDDTFVVWTGEFGRTPYSQENQDKNKKTDPMKRGRDHHHTAFSTLLAGGGIKGGLAYGTSDELGMNARKTKSTSTTCTPPSCISSASITNSSPTATPVAISGSPMCTATWCTTSSRETPLHCFCHSSWRGRGVELIPFPRH
jgi:hypothetical protein